MLSNDDSLEWRIGTKGQEPGKNYIQRIFFVISSDWVAKQTFCLRRIPYSSPIELNGYYILCTSLMSVNRETPAWKQGSFRNAFKTIASPFMWTKNVFLLVKRFCRLCFCKNFLPVIVEMSSPSSILCNPVYSLKKIKHSLKVAYESI